MAEGEVRKQVHAKVLAAYDSLANRLVPEGAGVAAELGEEKEEDLFGFFVSDGGFAKFKGSNALSSLLGAVDPKEHVKKVMDEVSNAEGAPKALLQFSSSRLFDKTRTF
jgi:hypothetical protein